MLTVTGVWLGLLEGRAVASPSMLVKLGLTATLFAILSYVHFGLQPRIDAVLATFAPGAAAPPEIAARIGALRLRRKRLSGICLFLVLSAAIAGVRMAFPFSPVLVALVVVSAAALAWRAYRTGVRYGYV